MKLQTLDVLQAIGDGTGVTTSEIMRRTDSSSGSLYPLLMRMEEKGFVASAWVPGPYPRRRVYWLSAAGQAVLHPPTSAGLTEGAI